MFTFGGAKEKTIFDKYKLHIIQNRQPILSGNRNLKYGLWDLPLKSKDINMINYIIYRDKNNVELAQDYMDVSSH